jgi:hypothetical protein
MAIGGEKRETTNFVEVKKYVGLFEGRVVAINPSAEEFAKLTNQPEDWKPKEDSKQFEYLGESKDGNVYLRVDVWLEDIKKRKETIVEEGEEIEKEVNKKFKVTFFLEDKQRENKDGSKMQYINEVGMCTWAEDENDLHDWFKERDYRIAFSGEEDLYNFMRKWMSKLDYRNVKTTLNLEWKKLMRGNVKELRDQINGEWSDNIISLATVEVKEKEDGSIVEYQKVYNRDFLYPYSMKFFRTVDYHNPEVLERLRTKKPKDLKPHEKFVLGVTDEEYGCKDYYILKDLTEYDASLNFAASDKTITDEHPDY